MPVQLHPPIKRATRRRYVLPGHWQHISARTQNGRYAFENFDPEFKARAWGYIGLANQRYGVQLAAFVLMSNHYHAVVKARHSRRISQWAQYVQAGLARLTHEFHGTHGTVWDGPFRHTNLLTHFTELSALEYVLSHGIKEGLVAHPGRWPGPNCVDALLFNAPIEGLWLDRDGWRAARRSNPRAPRAAFVHKVPIELTPLSVGTGSPEHWRQVCEEVIDNVLKQHLSPSLPHHHISQRDHTYIPESTKKSRVYCFDARISLEETDWELLRAATHARRSAVRASVEGLNQLANHAPRPREAPHGLQWPATVADALLEEVAEAPFPFRGPRTAGPQQASA